MIDNDNVDFVPSKFFIIDENGEHIIAEYDGDKVFNKSEECRSYDSEINRKTHDDNLECAYPLNIIRRDVIVRLHMSLIIISIRPHNGKLWSYRENSYKKLGDKYE